MSDVYQSMTELFRKENEFMKIQHDRQSNRLVTAIHGGGIEAGTSELAELIAEVSQTNYFTFKGLKSKHNKQLHVTSTHYDDPDLLNWNQWMEKTIAVHGCLGHSPVTYIGGTDKHVKKSIKMNLERAGFSVVEAPNHLAGHSANNVSNKNATGLSVQLELSTAQRKALFSHNNFSRVNRENRIHWTATMKAYARAVAEAIQCVSY